MDRNDTDRLSKYLSYLLRHHPDSLGLTLDAKGFVLLDQLISAIRKEGQWNRVTLDDIVGVIGSSEKKRFEIVEGKLRALYGHTFSSTIRHDNIVPPEILYHGTSRKNLESILTQGLLPMHRQYVHLSTTQDEAKSVGLRRDEHPIIVKVMALQAHRSGLKFYRAGSVILSEPIPPKFLVQKP